MTEIPSPQDPTAQNASPNQEGLLRISENRSYIDSTNKGTEDIPIPLAVPASGKAIRLQVLNGCGIKGMARIFAPVLRAKGFDVRETSNAGNFNYARSLVFDRTGALENAVTVADSLGIDPINVSTQIARNLVDVDVTLIVGTDYAKLRLNLPANIQR